MKEPDLFLWRSCLDLVAESAGTLGTREIHPVMAAVVSNDWHHYAMAGKDLRLLELKSNLLGRRRGAVLLSLVSLLVQQQRQVVTHGSTMALTTTFIERISMGHYSHLSIEREDDSGKMASISRLLA